MANRIGILTAGGDCPGSNAAIRGLGKALRSLGIEMIGFEDGFTGMVRNVTVDLSGDILSGILTSGGTILGTSREHPQALYFNDSVCDCTQAVVDQYHAHGLAGLAILGGSDALESADYLSRQGLNVIALPLTIDNDLEGTDVTVGFDSALSIAAEAIDRLHSTAYSYHRIIIVEIMGHDTGWLTLGAGIAGGADVILIPEIPYDEQTIARAILERRAAGKRFSIVAVSEGAISAEYRSFFENVRRVNQRRRSGEDQERVANRLANIEDRAAGNTIHLANQLEKYTDLQARITILGYLQRGGTPTATDRVLATELGAACAAMIHRGEYGRMVGMRGNCIHPVPLSEVAGRQKVVPLDHDWIKSARQVGTCLGD